MMSRRTVDAAVDAPVRIDWSRLRGRRNMRALAVGAFLLFPFTWCLDQAVPTYRTRFANEGGMRVDLGLLA
jgi:hypothetical protein